MAANSLHFTGQEVLSEDRKAAVLLELASILESGAFRGSRRCSRLLEYSVHQVLKGCPPEGLKERTIGIEALQRSPDYDTSEDAIVRVTANEVRKRLAQYYQGDGASAELIIGLPAGSYGVTFQWQQPATLPEPAQSGSRKGITRWVQLGVAACLLIAAGSIAVRGILAARSASASLVPQSRTKLDPVWSRVFNSSRKTNVVLSDAVYREIQYFLGRDVSLDEYLSPNYPSSLTASARPEAQSAIAFLGRQQTTSVGAASLGSRLLVFGARLGGDPAIRYPRHINAREFNTDNFILLGSRLSDPWEELFEPSLNFPLVKDDATHGYFLRNRAPRNGEQAEYREAANRDETYADIALLPNLSGNGTVLILNGIDMVAAEAAGEFAINGSLSSQVASAFGKADAGSRPPFFEILIRVRAVAGTAANTQVVAVRRIVPRNPGS